MVNFTRNNPSKTTEYMDVSSCGSLSEKWRALVWDLPLSPIKKLFLLALAELAGGADEWVVLDKESRTWISTIVGIPENKIKREIKSLKFTGLIETKKIAEHMVKIKLLGQPIPYAEFIEVKEYRPGYVYLVQAKEGHKIGRTQNLRRRLSQLRTGCPSNLRLVAARVVLDSVAYEKHLHDLLCFTRKHGEWFRLPEAESLRVAAALNQPNMVSATDLPEVDSTYRGRGRIIA